MPFFAITTNDLFGGFASLIYNWYPNRIQKGNRLRSDAQDQFVRDIEGAKKKIIISCQTFFDCKSHPDLNIDWFVNIVNDLKKRGVAIIMASEVEPPEFMQSLIDSKKIYFKKGDRVPFVGHFIDDKIIDISFDDRQKCMLPGGVYWRTERAMPDVNEMLKDALLASISYSFERLI